MGKSTDTRAALAEAVEAHAAVRRDVGHPDWDGTIRDAEDAAHAHLAEVDPGYFDRLERAREEFGIVLEPHQRVVAPDLKREYDAALEAHTADPRDPDLTAEAARLGEQYAAARTAQRVAEGRWEMAVHATPDPGGEG
jgi:hypothetical protein